MAHLHRRRQALREKLGDVPVILMNGRERPRNYAGNCYPFRGDSHFLYFFGNMPSGAAAIMHEDQALVFLDPVTLDDAVWSGPGPSWERLAEQAQVKIYPRNELTNYLDKIGRGRFASMPTQDPYSQAELRALLGRLPDPCGGGLDEQLAEAEIALRLQNDQASCEELRSIGKIGVRAHLAGMAATHVGADERDILAAMQSVCTKHGAVFSFEPIVSTAGERLHQIICDGPLQAGGMLLADFGAESASGWACDITNTWPVTGKYSAEQRDIYTLVLEAHKQCTAMLGPGVDYRLVHGRACRVLAQGLVELGLLRPSVEEILEHNLHAYFFPHGIGHLMGLDVHDMEDLGDLAGYGPGRSRSTRFGEKWLRLGRDLPAGVAVTIEPGLYFIPELLDSRQCRENQAFNWEKIERYRTVRGVRIERDYLITEQGSELLTPGLPDSCEEIEALVGNKL